MPRELTNYFPNFLLGSQPNRDEPGWEEEATPPIKKSKDKNYYRKNFCSFEKSE